MSEPAAESSREYLCDICREVVLILQPGSLVRKGTTFICSACGGGDGRPAAKTSRDDLEYLQSIFGMR